MITGSSIFSKRLGIELKKYDLPNYIIINPAKNQSHLLKKSCLKVARLDGCSYIKFSLENLSNFLNLRKQINLPEFKNFCQSSYYLDKILNHYLNRYNNYTIKYCDKIIFQSHLSKKMHLKFIGNNNILKNTIINNGAPKNFKTSNDIKANDNSFPNIVITANFRPVKRLKDAILLINYLSYQYKKILLHVVGSVDPLTNKEISKLDCSRVKFYGELKQEDLDIIYKNCDIGLSLCLYDACPNSVVEMMATGLPVITTKISGAFELLDYNNFFGVTEKIDMKYTPLQTISRLPEISYDSWSKKIVSIIENKQKYRILIKEIFEKNLEINIIAKKYAEFISE